MPHEIIMPALGMAQDSALLIAWRKAPGDAVKASDILFEVETDKTTMEVEAGFGGFVAELRSAPGADVPVGTVIAVISEEKPVLTVHAVAENPAAAKGAGAPQEGPKAAPPAHETKRVGPAAPARVPVKVPADGRILASPKAKRLAREQGLDLARLAAHGVPQPYHSQDIETLKSLATRAGSASAWSEIEARVPAAALDAFVALLEAEHPGAASGARIWAAFAAGSLRRALARGGEAIVVKVEAGQAAHGTFLDPDRSRLSHPADEADGQVPTVIVRDLSGTRLTRVRLGGDIVPVMTVTRDRDDYRLSLYASAEALPEEAALACLEDFAARVAAPIRHLL